jgi:hypothetical protein
MAVALQLLTWGIFKTYITLFCGKLIVFTLERICEYAAGEIRVRAITFPIKE